MDNMTQDGTATDEKPRGECTGCKFDYQLGTARAGEHKGELVVRKHNSRTGPGLCSGAQRPPAGADSHEYVDLATSTGVEHPGTAQECDLPECCPHPNGIGPMGCPCGAGRPEPDPFTAPAPVDVSEESPTGAGNPSYGPWILASFGSDCEGPCGGLICQGEKIRADGEGGWLCSVCGEDTEPGQTMDALVNAFPPASPDQLPVVTDTMPDQPHPTRGTLAMPPGLFPDPRAREADSSIAAANDRPTPDPFTAPGPVSDIPESVVGVSGQPEAERDRWGRYLLPAEGGRKQAHTRATTFAKLGANTKAIEQWGHRQVAVGLVRRPDLLALAEGKDVKRDRKELNSIVDQARDAAGQKVAANIGTAYHSFTERVDAGLMTVEQVPERYRGRVQQYVEVTRAAGLSMRPEWIERATAVRADQVSAPLPVAGTLDRIVQLPDGSLVIADLKTGADLSYGEMEIEVQLAVYAHGVNTHGLFDWNTGTWQDFRGDTPGVREDIAIVIHLPADGDGCTLYVADIARGWADAQHLGRLQASLKAKNRFRTLTRADLEPASGVVAPVQSPAEQQAEAWQGVPQVLDPWAPEHMAAARKYMLIAPDLPTVAQLYQYAIDSGSFTDQELGLLQSLGTKRLRDLGLVPA